MARPDWFKNPQHKVAQSQYDPCQREIWSLTTHHCVWARCCPHGQPTRLSSSSACKSSNIYPLKVHLRTITRPGTGIQTGSQLSMTITRPWASFTTGAPLINPEALSWDPVPHITQPPLTPQTELTAQQAAMWDSDGDPIPPHLFRPLKNRD
jgi:hypothetical protein